MSTSADEFEFTDFTEEELSQIDSIAEAAFATESVVWPITSSNTELGTKFDTSEPIVSKSDSRSRKSSGLTVIDLTEEEFKLLDQSVADLESSIQLPPEIDPPATASTRPPTQHIEVSVESPLPSTLAASPAPTLGRSSSLSPAPPTMSLYSLFRSSRNSLSVSDLVGPVWCELQYDYGLRGGRHLPASQRPAVVTSRTGKAISVQKDVIVKNDAIKQKGTTVHKRLEREIRPTEIAVTTKTREDRWGLKLLDMVSNMRILIDEGRCREMPVMGFIQGHFVTGIIDEIVRAAVPPPSPTIPGYFPDDKKLDSSIKYPSHAIHILDNKTRGVPSIPKSRDSHQSRLQLMLYKRLLDMVIDPLSTSPSLSSSFSFPAVWAHQSVNPLVTFSDQFLEESASLVAGNQLGPAAAQAKCLDDLVRAWEEVVEELAGGGQIGDNDGAVSKTLKLVYRLRERTSGYKRSSIPSSSSSDAGPSNHTRHPDSPSRTKQTAKKLRADSEEVELQRAIHASLNPNSSNAKNDIQEGTIDVIREEQKDGAGVKQISEERGKTPGEWVSNEDDLQRAVRESIRTYEIETGSNAVLPSIPPTLSSVSRSPQLSDRGRKKDSDANIIGVVEFEHDKALLDQHLSSVLDFWHDRRPPRGVALEDTGRCSHCEFYDGCEWLETKAAEITSTTKG